MKKYVFIQTPNGATPSGYQEGADGRLYEVGFLVEGTQLVQGGEYPRGKILSQPNYAKIMQYDQFKAALKIQGAAINNQSTIKNDMYNQPKNNAALVAIETPNGQMTTGREETQFQGGGETMTINVSLDFTTGVTGPIDVLIGDGSGIIGNALGIDITAYPATLVVGGTFGTQTLALLKQMSATDYLRLHTYQGEANTNTYWSTGIPARQYTTNVQGSTSFVNLDFNLNQDGSQFNEQIRRIGNWRFVLGTMTALVQTLNDGDLVNLTFRAQSLGSARTMQMVK